ncbi:MAG: hypothetical protein ABL896_02980 [Hylemonella sp.]
MRVLFLALMIALLPLRGWVGDVMAMNMTTAALLPAEAPDAPTRHHEPAAQTHGQANDCPGHTGAGASASADCSTCTACQICHSVALTPAVPQLVSSLLPTDRPQTTIRQYASAERAPGFKPPIS